MSRWLAALRRALRASPRRRRPRRRRRSSATRPSSCTTAASRDPLTSVQAFAGRVPGVEPGRARPAVYGRRAGAWLQYWMFFAAQLAGPRPAPHGPARGRLGDGPVPAAPQAAGAGGLRAALRRRVVRLRLRPARRDPPGGLRRARLARRRTSCPGCATARGPTRTTRPTAAACACARGSCGSASDARHGCATPGRWGASRAGWVPGEMDSPRGPAFQRRALERSGRVGRGRAPVHAAGLRQARRVRRARDGDRGRAGRARTGLGVPLRPAADAAPGGRAGRRAAEAQAAARCPDSCQGVRIRGPSAVIATVNSKCAASEPSCE